MYSNKTILAKATCCIVILFVNGCASSSLWKNHKYANARNVIQAEATQIYSSYDTSLVNGSQRYHPKFCIQYKVNDNDMLSAKKISLPEKTAGYLIIRNPAVYVENALQKDKMIIKLFEDPTVDVSSIYAAKLDDDWQLSIAFTSSDKSKWKDIPSGIDKLKEIPPSISNYKYPYSSKSNISTTINDEDSYYYRPCCTYKTETIYANEFDNKDWMPILPSTKVPLPMSFYQVEPEVVYENSVLSRVFLTPFAVVADTATFPFQLLFILLWSHSGPR